MKRMYKSIISSMLVAVMITAQLPGLARTTIPFVGDILRTNSREISDKLFFDANSLNHNIQGIEEENYFTLSPNSSIKPIIVNGSYIYNSGQTLSQAATSLQSKGYTVVGGMIGDMYNTMNGVPLGIVVRDGILRTCDNARAAVGFTSTGRTIISYPYLTMKLQFTNASGVVESIPINRLNRLREKDSVCMYTSDFSTNTQTTLKGKHVAITGVSPLQIGKSVSGTVNDSVTTTTAYNLSAGTIVLSASSDAQIALLDKLAVGTNVTITITSSNAAWNDVVNACGAANTLLVNSVTKTGLPTDKAPRSAIGVKDDGTAVFYTVDGRQTGYSNGMTLTDVAERLKAMGCTHAIELDGGGSTAIGTVSPGDTAFNIVNKPSDKVLRKSAGYIFFVNTNAKINDISRLHLSNNSLKILPNTQFTFSAKATDSNWHPMNVSQIPLTWSSSNQFVGTVSNGVFTASQSGATEIKVEYMAASGNANVEVVSTVDSVEVFTGETKITTLRVAPGEAIQFNAKAMLDTFPVFSNNNSFTWTVSENIGTISPQGQFSAATTTGAIGQLVVSAVGRTVAVPITIAADPEIIQDFEASNSSSVTTVFYNTASQSAIVLDKDAARGIYAARFDYEFDSQLMSDIQLPLNAKYLNMQIKGNDDITVNFLDSFGQINKVQVTSVTTDYQVKTIAIPVNSVKIVGISVLPTAAKGSIYIDQIVAMYDQNVAVIPPVITISNAVKANGQLTYSAAIVSQSGLKLNKEDILVTFDGKSIPFNYTQPNAQIIINEPATDLHMLTIEASDIFGNRSHAAVQLKYPRSQASTRLQDVSGWLEPFADFLDDRGFLITSEKSGLRYYKPKEFISRIEMFEMIMKISGINVDNYSEVEIPFTDKHLIPAEKLNYVKAAYEVGYLGGILSSDGSLRLGVGENMKRQDFAVVINKLLPKGYIQSAMVDNPDKSNISAYATKAMSTLVEMGLLAGNEKKELLPHSYIKREEVATILTKAFF